MVVSLAFVSVKAYGPYDYTNPEHVRDKLPIVEQYHFNADVENLTGTMGDATVGANLWYVIRTFPNHHRALNSYARLWRRYLKKGQIPPGVSRGHTPEYCFERAMQFAPHDGVVPMLYGNYLYQLGKLDQALKLYKQAAAIIPDSPELHYNLGLLYLEENDYRLASVHAKKAYDLGFPLPGLRNKLIRAGVWKP
jgi:tetratricopeptide (TPR) repeat protein